MGYRLPRHQEDSPPTTSLPSKVGSWIKERGIHQFWWRVGWWRGDWIPFDEIHNDLTSINRLSNSINRSTSSPGLSAWRPRPPTKRGRHADRPGDDILIRSRDRFQLSTNKEALSTKRANEMIDRVSGSLPRANFRAFSVDSCQSGMFIQ